MVFLGFVGGRRWGLRGEESQGLATGGVREGGCCCCRGAVAEGGLGFCHWDNIASSTAGQLRFDLGR